MPGLSPETQQAIDKAFADKAASDTADATEQSALAAMVAAQDAHDTAISAEADAHKASADSAHAALALLAKDFGVALPT